MSSSNLAIELQQLGHSETPTNLGSSTQQGASGYLHQLNHKTHHRRLMASSTPQCEREVIKQIRVSTAHDEYIPRQFLAYTQQWNLIIENILLLFH